MLLGGIDVAPSLFCSKDITLSIYLIDCFLYCNCILIPIGLLVDPPIKAFILIVRITFV